jgi:hypothetical protein
VDFWIDLVANYDDDDLHLTTWEDKADSKSKHCEELKHVGHNFNTCSWLRRCVQITCNRQITCTVACVQHTFRRTMVANYAEDTQIAVWHQLQPDSSHTVLSFDSSLCCIHLQYRSLHLFTRQYRVRFTLQYRTEWAQNRRRQHSADTQKLHCMLTPAVRPAACSVTDKSPVQQLLVYSIRFV